jgi:hypothetical protein
VESPEPRVGKMGMSNIRDKVKVSLSRESEVGRAMVNIVTESEFEPTPDSEMRVAMKCGFGEILSRIVARIMHTGMLDWASKAVRVRLKLASGASWQGSGKPGGAGM